MPIPTTFESFEVLGTTDEVTTCDCCGKNPLKATVAISFDDAEPVFFGSTCAAKAAKIAPKIMAKAVRSADKAKQKAKEAAATAASRARTDAFHAFVKERSGETDAFLAIQSLGGFVKARAAFLEVGGEI